ncbi:MAG: hypothetical protein JNM69_23390 [Archangium sp.]|nr:hypothetical protein [Archangium sp.]
MFVVNNRPATPPRRATEPTAPTAPAGAPTSPRQDPFATSSFEPAAAVRSGATTPYFPTMAELSRPTTATVLNITNGDRQPLNPLQMSTEQGAAFIQGRLQALGYSGPGQVANTTSPTSGPYRIEYGTDDRRHWDIDGMNVGLAQQWYAQFGPEVADRMLAADMKYARKTSWENDDGPTVPQNLLTPVQQQQQPALSPMRFLPGTNVAAQLQQVQPRQAAPAAWTPTREDVNRPTTATSLNILTGDRTPLNPAQMSNEQGIAFVRERLSALGYSGAGTLSNQTAPTSGPFGIDYGSDDRRHWDIDGMNVGLTLQLYANNPREVADRMLADMLRTQMPRTNQD